MRCRRVSHALHVCLTLRARRCKRKQSKLTSFEVFENMLTGSASPFLDPLSLPSSSLEQATIRRVFDDLPPPLQKYHEMEAVRPPMETVSFPYNTNTLNVR